MKKKYFITFLLLFMISSFFCCSCGKTQTASNDATFSYYEFEPVTPIIEGQPNIYAVLKVIDSQYWQEIISGITQAGEKSHVNVYVGGPSNEAAWDIQVEMCNRAIENGADALLIAPCDSSKLSEPIASYHAKNIPVILVDTIINGHDYDICYMTDNLEGGSMAAEAMLKQLHEMQVSEDETIQIAIQITSTASQTVIDRLAGFNQYWAKHAPQKWTVLDEIKTNGGDTAIAKQNCIDFISQYPDVRGVFGCNNSSTIGFVRGLTSNGRNDIALVGFDYADETAGFIADDNWYASTIVQKQFDMGYNGILSALDLIEEKQVDYKFVDTGVLIVDQDNYQSYEASLQKGSDS